MSQTDMVLKALATFNNAIKAAHRYAVQVSDTTMLPIAASLLGQLIFLIHCLQNILLKKDTNQAAAQAIHDEHHPRFRALSYSAARHLDTFALTKIQPQ